MSRPNNGAIEVPDRVEALIFDCDGTLADTMPLHYRAWQELLERRQLELPESLFYKLAGMPTVEIVPLMNRELGLDFEPQATTKEKEGLFLQYLSEVTPIAPVVEVVEGYRGRLPMGVGSGNLRPLVDVTLEHIGLGGIFEVIVTIEDVERGKPAPDTFLEVARRLGVEPGVCQVFEDGDLGLEAARQAGMVATDVRPYLP